MAEMLIASKAANCRRMETQSGSPAHFAINYSCQHLALEPAERGRPTKMEVTVQGAHHRCDSQVDRKNLKHTRNDTAILATNPAKEELPDSSGLFWHDCHDVRHFVSPS